MAAVASARKQKRIPYRPQLWASEKMARELGFGVVAGLDEVGMGPLAGPVVAGAVVLPWHARLPGIKDSKALTHMQRERLDVLIRRRALGVSVCAVTSEEVDRIGLTKARNQAMLGALSGLAVPAEYLLIDAYDLPEAPLPQMAVIKGDATCASIMAASIVAKVFRDRAMIEFDALYPGYGFARHKGYATRDHREAVRLLGPSPIHRVSWAPFREFVNA
ncbi:MAG TPA: ribonuclease HII [Candidatus Dormibacteraeota bacterium]